MTIATIYEGPRYQRAVQPDTSLNREVTRWTLAVFVSFVLGTTAAVIGFALTTLAELGVVGFGSTLSSVGAVLMIAAFPLFLLGAHCLDRADAADKAIRVEYCRQNGLDDSDR